MGNDGGSIPKRIELVKEKQKEVRPDQNVQQIASWFFCALSKLPLEAPVVSCSLGKLYNRDVIIEYLIKPELYGDGDRICSHIGSIRDVRTLTLTPNPTFKEVENGPTIANYDQGLISKFICPLSMKEMNGKQRFVYLDTCGCVFSEQALKEVPTEECTNCGKPYKAENIITINPTRPEEIERMKAAMVEKARVRAEKKEKKKAKAEAKTEAKAADKLVSGADTTSAEPSSSTTKRKADIDLHPPQKKVVIALPGETRIPSPTAAVVGRVVQELAEKQKKEVSSAIKSIYKKGDKSRGNYLTKGTFTRYA